jgi:photosystem II stability/assembly factor-like uncharacterized protein
MRLRPLSSTVARIALGLVVAASAAVATTSTGQSADVLDRPARISALAERRPIAALAHAGRRLVAAGQRGHILLSDDDGGSWRQAAVPVSSDLTALSFPTAATGYAVGHDGVVLGTTDGGATWRKLLDGRAVNALVLDAMRRKFTAEGGDEARKLLAEARRNVELGPDKPFLDAWFADANEGFVIGAYNLILHTVDGGRTWDSWFDATDNPKLLNLYAIRPLAGALFIVGEGGLLLVRDPGAQRFRGLASDYPGSFFGVLGLPAASGAVDGVLAFGMRGHALLSHDHGAHWRARDTGLTASITAGEATADGRVVLVDQSGSIAVSRDGGETFARVAVAQPMPLAAVAVTPAGIVLAGPRGLREIDRPAERAGSNPGP